MDNSFLRDFAPKLKESGFCSMGKCPECNAGIVMGIVKDGKKVHMEEHVDKYDENGSVIGSTWDGKSYVTTCEKCRMKNIYEPREMDRRVAQEKIMREADLRKKEEAESKKSRKNEKSIF